MMMLKGYDKSSQNYFDGKCFIFNIYKTAKNYGEKTIALPKELCDILKKWKKINTGNMLLYQSNHKPLQVPQVTRNLNNIFGKKVSASMLRHSYATDFYKQPHTLKDMIKVSGDMSHSVLQNLEYAKNS